MSLCFIPRLCRMTGAQGCCFASLGGKERENKAVTSLGKPEIHSLISLACFLAFVQGGREVGFDHFIVDVQEWELGIFTNTPLVCLPGYSQYPGAQHMPSSLPFPEMSFVPPVLQGTNVRSPSSFSDLLFPLFLPLCSITSLWSDEACPCLHSLLHVPRHSFL